MSEFIYNAKNKNTIPKKKRDVLAAEEFGYKFVKPVRITQLCEILKEVAKNTGSRMCLETKIEYEYSPDGAERISTRYGGHLKKVTSSSHMPVHLILGDASYEKDPLIDGIGFMAMSAFADDDELRIYLSSINKELRKTYKKVISQNRLLKKP